MDLARMPTQAPPVNRSRLLQSFTVEYQVGTNAAGKDTFLDVVVGPEPNDRAHFSPKVDPSLGVCHVLSSYAVARCFRAGGLF
jgi:ABC-type uncharacterized transport system ATPase subunit